jgi:hypothetical protein
MMSDYFNYVNKETDGRYESIEEKMSIFCQSNNLQVKAIKEVHFLCLQLERLVQEATTTKQPSIFTRSDFE